VAGRARCFRGGEFARRREDAKCVGDEGGVEVGGGWCCGAGTEGGRRGCFVCRFAVFRGKRVKLIRGDMAFDGGTEAEGGESHGESSPGPTQRCCVGLVGRGIGFLTQPRLAISKGLEAIDVDVPVRKQVRRQDGDGQPAEGAEETRDENRGVP